MKKILPFIVFMGLIACDASEKKSTIQISIDNEEMAAIYENDQSDRLNGNIDWSIVSTRDEMRRDVSMKCWILV